MRRLFRGKSAGGWAEFCVAVVVAFDIGVDDDDDDDDDDDVVRNDFDCACYSICTIQILMLMPTPRKLCLSLDFSREHNNNKKKLKKIITRMNLFPSFVRGRKTKILPSGDFYLPKVVVPTNTSYY
jgi:hypothetical protein